MKISIVIPAFNEERLLGQTLAHITSVRPVFAAAGWESELIVCDQQLDGSHGGDCADNN